MNKFKMKVTAVIGVILLIGIYYYVTLPAINISCPHTFWMYPVVLVITGSCGIYQKEKFKPLRLERVKGIKGDPWNPCGACDRICGRLNFVSPIVNAQNIRNF